MVKRSKSESTTCQAPNSGNSFEDDTGTATCSSAKNTNPPEEDDPSAPEIVLSNKGGPKLIHRGFMYTLHKKQPHNIRWRCVGRTMHCRGSLITSPSCSKPRLRSEHNHKPDFAAAQVARKRYLALGKPRILPGEALRKTLADASRNNEPREDGCSPEQPQQQRSKTRTTPPSRNRMLQSSGQSSTAGKTIRIAAQSLMRSHVRNIASSGTAQQHSQSQSQSQSHSQSQSLPQSLPQPLPQPQLQAQQAQRQPKTLVLKTIPLKVKQVAPTTIKMAPRQVSQAVPQNILHQQPTEVCLRWNSYHSNMQSSFPSLLDTEQFVDVTLACEGRSLKCHKMILSSCSDYLAELLRENPCQHPIILMKDLKFWEVEALVKFMYRGEVNVAHDKLPQLLNAAEALQVKGLAGPSPSAQGSKPPLLIPQSKPLIPQPVAPRLAPDTKEPKTASSASTASSSPKRAQKRQQSEPIDPKPFTKIRLQRPTTPTSPLPTIKMEPLDSPLSPNEIFPENNQDSSNPSHFDKLISLHEEDDPGGNETNDADTEMNFCGIPGPPDINDTEDQMEFVPSDFLEQEQDIVEESEILSSKDIGDESREGTPLELELDATTGRNGVDKEHLSRERKPV